MSPCFRHCKEGQNKSYTKIQSAEWKQTECIYQARVPMEVLYHMEHLLSKVHWLIPLQINITYDNNWHRQEHIIKCRIYNYNFPLDSILLIGVDWCRLTQATVPCETL